MDNTIDIKKIQILLDLEGEPVNKGGICLSTGHGHYAYVSDEVDDFINDLFREMGIWRGATDIHKTYDHRYFSQFELDCAAKSFLKSRIFKRICEHHKVNFVILDNGENDAQIAREFWNQMQRR